MTRRQRSEEVTWRLRDQRDHISHFTIVSYYRVSLRELLADEQERLNRLQTRWGLGSHHHSLSVDCLLSPLGIGSIPS